MPIINRNTPTEQITVPVPTPVQTKPKSQGSAPPAVQQVQQRRPTQHQPISFGGENDEFGRPAHQLSAVIMPWVPNKSKQLSRRNPKRYAGETTEEDFHRLLDANPDDHHARLVFADWLQERNDPRAEGYRALGMMKKYPYTNDSWTHEGNPHPSERPSINEPNVAHYPIQHRLPRDWFNLVENTHPHYHREGYHRDNNWVYHINRREADDEAAHAFSQLPPERKHELLNPKQLSRKRILVITYKRPNLTPAQKDRAKKIELVVLPTGIEGKKCGTCKYGRHHKADKSSNNLYCFNNQVHMNVKSNWGCKLWDAKGVKKLSRKSIMVKKYGRAPAHEVNALLRQNRGHFGSVEPTTGITPEGILADKLDDHDDPRGEVLRRDLEYRNHPMGYGHASNTHFEHLASNYPNHEITHGEQIHTPIMDNLHLAYTPIIGRSRNSTKPGRTPIAYLHEMYIRGENSHAAYFSPEEHERLMSKLEG